MSTSNSNSSNENLSIDMLLNGCASDMIHTFAEKKAEYETRREGFIKTNKVSVLEFINNAIEKIRNSGINVEMSVTVIVRRNCIICIPSNIYKLFKSSCDFLTNSLIADPHIITNKNGDQFHFQGNVNFMFYTFTNSYGNDSTILDISKIVNEYFNSLDMHNILTEHSENGKILHFHDKKQFFYNTFARPILSIVHQYVKWSCINSNDSKFQGNIVILKRGIICMTNKMYNTCNFDSTEFINLVMEGRHPDIHPYSYPPIKVANLFVYRNYLINLVKEGKIDECYLRSETAFEDNTIFTSELLDIYFKRSEISVCSSGDKNHTSIHFEGSF